MSLRPALVPLACALIAFACAFAVRADNSDPKQELNEARRDGWTAARSAVDTLRRDAVKQPAKRTAIAEWIADFDQVAATTGADGLPGRTRPLQVDALVSRNPKFWRGTYEAPPADPAMMMLHGALLLAAGEATRARYVFVLASQHPRLPPEWREAFGKMTARTHAAGLRSRELVLEGLRLRNQRDFPAALEKMTDALVHWPQNAIAYWEIGRTLREQAWEATRNLELPDPPEVGAALARARQHDPLLMEAYQSGDPALRKRLMALLSNQGPAWLRLNQTPDRQASPEILERLATALQRAGLDELALVAYQAVRARRGNAEPADQHFIATSLGALVPAAISR